MATFSMPPPFPDKLPTYVFKLVWRATVQSIKVEAKTYHEALRNVERQVKKMEGGDQILDIQFLERRG